jgi:hypothetical protein
MDAVGDIIFYITPSQLMAMLMRSHVSSLVASPFEWACRLLRVAWIVATRVVIAASSFGALF